MTRDQLTAAANTLQSAAGEATDEETRDRLQTQSAQFAALADAERGPDHGKLARHEHVLTEIADDTGGEVEAAIEDALESIRAYRETVEGV
ncbi:hypothetical protein D8Y22_00165 [Salinadaptatus halalkaliphilus]|uniref:Uncharacterized protein n=1 Tax=Salinadaptatus halalkaliphilus TaxID=2419781 RepID=A0A4S3TQL6_9EURY|nr:hypothetical protein [Salinadaptatus halalkaliphilus]THE66586.1 hypothetical protein D8Y22_00165 [Salinadaptatus halalkaliphilus]